MIEICEARYESGYKIWVQFNTGENGIADLEDILQKHKAAAPLLNLNEFKQFYLDGWPTLAWRCGFDVSPESLYERVTGKLPEWAKSDSKEGESHA